MSESLRRCALPGCDKVIEESNDGGPPRLYCSPAHRIAARKQRYIARLAEATGLSSSNEESQTTGVSSSNEKSPESTPTATPNPADPDQTPSPTASWMVSPTPLNVADEGKKNGKRMLSPAERKDAARRMRRRTIATIAAASMVIGGSGYVLTDVATPTATPSAQAPRTTFTPSNITPEEWVRRAEVVLASVNRQLDLINQTEAAWNAAAAQLALGEPPALKALKERKALLEQQRATLQSQINAIRALPDAEADLEKAQAELDAIERALRTATPPSTTQDPGHAEALRNLTAQREMRVQQRDQNAQEVETLRSGIQQALATPLPDATDRTTPIIEQLLSILEGAPKPEQPKTKKHPQPPAVIRPREGIRQQHRDEDRGAPPEPGTGLDAKAARVTDAVRGAVKNVGDAVRTVLAAPKRDDGADQGGNGSGGTETPQTQEQPSQPQTGTAAVTQPVSNAVGAVSESAGKVVEAVTEPVNDAVEAVTKPVGEAVEAVTKPVSNAVDAVTKSVNEVARSVTNALLGRDGSTNGNNTSDQAQPSEDGAAQPQASSRLPLSHLTGNNGTGNHDSGQERGGSTAGNGTTDQAQRSEDGAAQPQASSRLPLSHLTGNNGTGDHDSGSVGSVRAPGQTAGNDGGTSRVQQAKELVRRVHDVAQASPADRSTAIKNLVETATATASPQEVRRLAGEAERVLRTAGLTEHGATGRNAVSTGATASEQKVSARKLQQPTGRAVTGRNSSGTGTGSPTKTTGATAKKTTKPVKASAPKKNEAAPKKNEGATRTTSPAPKGHIPAASEKPATGSKPSATAGTPTTRPVKDSTAQRIRQARADRNDRNPSHDTRVTTSESASGRTGGTVTTVSHKTSKPDPAPTYTRDAGKESVTAVGKRERIASSSHNGGKSSSGPEYKINIVTPQGSKNTKPGKVEGSAPSSSVTVVHLA